MTDPLERLIRAPNLRVRSEGEGRSLIYNPATDGLHVVGEVEARILDLCDGRLVDEVIAEAAPWVAERESVGDSQAAGEVLCFLGALAKRGLVCGGG